MDGLQHIHRQGAYHLPGQSELFEDAVGHFLLGEFVSVHSSEIYLFSDKCKTAARRQMKAQEEICPDLGLIRLAAENHTVNHTPNKEWGFPKHVYAGKPHSGISRYVCRCNQDFSALVATYI